MWISLFLVRYVRPLCPRIPVSFLLSELFMYQSHCSYLLWQQLPCDTSLQNCDFIGTKAPFTQQPIPHFVLCSSDSLAFIPFTSLFHFSIRCSFFSLHSDFMRLDFLYLRLTAFPFLPLWYCTSRFLTLRPLSSTKTYFLHFENDFPLNLCNTCLSMSGYIRLGSL